jgi:hypothetical protein
MTILASLPESSSTPPRRSAAILCATAIMCAARSLQRHARRASSEGFGDERLDAVERVGLRQANIDAILNHLLLFLGRLSFIFGA